MGRVRLNRGVPAVWALNAALVAAAVALYHHVGALPAPVAAVAIPWWALALAFAITEISVVHVHYRRNSHTLAFGELPLIVGLLFCSPGEVVLAWVAGAALVLLAIPGRVAFRIVFNLAQLAITAGIAGTVFHAITGDGAALGPLMWVAATLAVLIAVAVSVLLVNAAMWVSGESIHLRGLAMIVAMSTCVAAINSSLGLVAATVVATDPRAIVLLATPVLAIFLAYRAHLAERRQAANLQFLHEASRTLSTASNAPAGIAGMLAMTLENFRGEVAEVCLFPADGEGEGSRISVGGQRGLEVMQPLDERVVRELTELMERDSAARLVTPEDVGGALAGHLQRLGVQSAMLASLPGLRRTIGTVMVADRSGIGGLFDPSEIRLFDTLAHQTGAAVGQDSLTTKVDELRELQVELEHQAFHDPLTGLANRLLFMNRVEFVLQRRTGNAAVIYLDLDNFKPINDTHGHEAGDAVLKAAGDRLTASLRPADTAARLGGDEFAVLLVDIPEEHIGVVADRIVANLSQPLEFADLELTVGASLGVASAASGTLDADSLVRNADVAMYVAKHGGKGRLSVFEQPEAVAA
ncbi:MAG TPA: GGDEF domain-containing protein [Solirubrobacteraceae bacterium]|nr:GGDEF domain-containing protein [Solirubrobacteraceae bacterium]